MYQVLIGLGLGFLAFTEKGRQLVNTAASKAIEAGKSKVDKLLAGIKEVAPMPDQDAQEPITVKVEDNSDGQ